MEMLRPHRRYETHLSDAPFTFGCNIVLQRIRYSCKDQQILIDNQLSECVFPVILTPVPPPKSVTKSTDIIILMRKTSFIAFPVICNFNLQV